MHFPDSALSRMRLLPAEVLHPLKNCSGSILTQEASPLTRHFPLRWGRSSCWPFRVFSRLRDRTRRGAPDLALLPAPRPSAASSPFCRSLGPRPPPSSPPSGARREEPAAGRARELALGIGSLGPARTNGVTSAPVAPAPPLPVTPAAGPTPGDEGAQHAESWVGTAGQGGPGGQPGSPRPKGTPTRDNVAAFLSHDPGLRADEKLGPGRGGI